MASAASERAAAEPRAVRLRPALRAVHRTVGLIVALYVLMASLTGAALLFRAEILAAANPQLGPPPPDLIARAEQLAARLDPGSFTAIRFPDAALGAFTVHRPEHRTELFDPHTLAPVPDRFGANAAMDWLFDLHHYLLAGETGRIASGVFGIAIVLLIGIGIYLWWPWRKGWRLKHATPARPTRASRLAAHTSTAILVAPTLLLAAVTGSAVVFHETTRGALTGLFGKADPALEPAQRTASLADHVATIFPGGTPRLLIPPAPDGQLTVRVKESSELHPNGRSTLRYDPGTGRATAATSDARSGLGNAIYNSLYPLHTGAAGGLLMRIIILVGALAAFWSCLFALRSRLTGKRKPAKAAVRAP